DRAARGARKNTRRRKKKWLEIGMLLMQNPEFLLVDEPVAGMAPHEIERTAELLLSLAGEHSVVVVKHDMYGMAKTRLLKCIMGAAGELRQLTFDGDDLIKRSAEQRARLGIG